MAYGLRAACAIGEAVGVTPPDRVRRIRDVLDGLGLATAPLPYSLETVLDHLAADKKHVAGQLRWVLPAESGVEVLADVPLETVRLAAAELLAAGSMA